MRVRRLALAVIPALCAAAAVAALSSNPASADPAKLFIARPTGTARSVTVAGTPVRTKAPQHFTSIEKTTIVKSLNLAPTPTSWRASPAHLANGPISLSGSGVSLIVPIDTSPEEVAQSKYPFMSFLFSGGIQSGADLTFMFPATASFLVDCVVDSGGSYTIKEYTTQASQSYVGAEHLAMILVGTLNHFAALHIQRTDAGPWPLYSCEITQLGGPAPGMGQ